MHYICNFDLWFMNTVKYLGVSRWHICAEKYRQLSEKRRSADPICLVAINLHISVDTTQHNEALYQN
jgi:hypothetical protein